MTTATELPTLDLAALVEFIEWAELSHQHGGVVPGKESWGSWRQEAWAIIGRNTPAGHREDRNGVCGTAFCIAGQTVWQNGYRIIGAGRAGQTAEMCFPEMPTGEIDSKGRMIWKDVPDGKRVPIDAKAQEILGITDYEAEYLFSGENDIEDLKSVTNWLCERRRLAMAYPGEDEFRPDISEEEWKGERS